MKTFDLNNEQVTLADLLKFASAGSIRILAPDGHAFVLEEADDFDLEVETLSKSQRFQQFLDERSKEPATISLEELRRSPE